MSGSDHVIYEVSLEIDPAIVGQYDVWLEQHLREVLEVEGFEIGRVFKPDAAAEEGAWIPRVVQYTVRSRHDLERYLAGPAQAMRQKGIDRFGERFRATRRVLDPTTEICTPSTRGGGDGALTSCPNCGSSLNDQFCAHCGQENKATVLAFHRVVSDFLGDLFNFDSRLFNSFGPLLFKPGQLTAEYVAGRRARFIPPVRMYLFLSLFFFGVATFGVSEELVMTDEDRVVDTTSESAASTPGDGGSKERRGSRPQINITSDSEGFWKEFEDRAQKRAERLKDEPGYRAELIQSGIGNLPLMMFVLLPVYALLLKILYIRSGRYYVEHIIYSLHLHSFIFLVLGGLIAWWLALDATGYQPDAPWWLITGFWTWFALYPFFAMRRVYGQGRFKTALKYLLLGFVYFILLTCGIVGVVLMTLAY